MKTSITIKLCTSDRIESVILLFNDSMVFCSLKIGFLSEKGRVPKKLKKRSYNR